MKVLFYISGHGFGHATRAVATMNALALKEPNIRLYVKTRASEILFENLPPSLRYYDTTIDVGVVEKDIFFQDAYSTLSQYAKLISKKDRIINKESGFIKKEKIKLIVSDIPPLASDIGRAASIPTIAIGNFSWDFIYKPYVLSYPEFKWLIDEIRLSYGKTDLLLRLPMHHEMAAFSKQRDIPLVSRKSTSDSETIRLQLGIPKDDKRSIILIAMRMNDTISAAALKDLLSHGEFILACAQALPFKSKDIHVFGSKTQFHEVVNVSDLVISKLGYGIISECIVGRTPLMYIPRYDFAEFEILRTGIKNILPSFMIDRKDISQGKLYEHIKKFLSQEICLSEVQTNGADVAADIILSYL